MGDKKLVEFIEVEDVANLVEGAPDKLAEGLLYFAQGRGLLSGAPMAHVHPGSRTDVTMQDLDKSDI